jgi:hypothetical protein
MEYKKHRANDSTFPMTIPSKLSRSTIEQLGRLVIYWNDFEIQIRSLLLVLTNDPETAAILSAGFETDALFSAVRTLASEYDASRKRLNTRFMIEADNGNIKVRLYEEAAAHVHHLIDCADGLREYRNMYVQGVCSPRKSEGIKTHGYHPIRPLDVWIQLDIPEDLNRITTEILDLTKYAITLITCIQKNDAKKTHVRLLWPIRPPLPEILRRH